MWFTDSAGVAVGRITPQGAITEYSAPQYTDERAQGLAFGADGRPWFVTFGPKPLLVHVTKQGTLSVVHLPPGLSPDGSLVSDRGGNLWFVAINLSTAAILVERRTDGTLVKIPTHLVSMAKPCCPNLAPKRLVIGPNGNPWFTSLSYGSARSPANFIGRDEAGRVTLIRVTNKGVPYPTYPSGLAAGSAKLWFTSGNPFLPNGALTQMDTQGNQVAYQVPYNPLGLTVDGNGHPWFTTLWSGLPSQIVEATVR